MSTLAHEGNPKEDLITITGGSVLSTAQLDIDFLFFGNNPTLPSPAEPALTQRVQSCPDVFYWTDMEMGQDIMYLRQTPASGNNVDRYLDQTLDLTIHSSPNCYGVISQKYYPLNFNNPASYGPLEWVWRVAFMGVISGTPRAGICFNVLDDLTDANNVQLYAAVIDMELDDNGIYTGNIKVCRWNNESLGDLTTPLFTLSTTPNVGDQLYLNMYQEIGYGFNYLYCALYDSVGSVREDSTFFMDDPDLQMPITNRVRHPRMRVGFVSIGGKQDGICKFQTVVGSYISGNTTPWLFSSQVN